MYNKPILILAHTQLLQPVRETFSQDLSLCSYLSWYSKDLQIIEYTSSFACTTKTVHKIGIWLHTARLLASDEDETTR